MIDNFFKFNYKAKEILQLEIDGVKLSECLSYGFLAPLSEEFPDNKPKTIKDKLRLVRDVAKSFYRVLSPSHKPNQLNKPPTPVWLMTLKERSYKYWEHVIPELESLSLNPQLISGNPLSLKTPSMSLVESLSRLERVLLCFRFLQLCEHWYFFRNDIDRLATPFIGQINNMKTVWFTRGLDTIVYVRALTKLIKEHKPALIILQDPTEVSQSALWAAGQYNFQLGKDRHDGDIFNTKTGIPLLFYAPFDDGIQNSRDLWTYHMPTNHLAVLNKNQGHKDAKKTIVGDTSFIKPKGLVKFEKTALLLSRHVGNVFSKEQKEYYYKTVFQAAKKSNLEIYIKCHPYEKPSQTRKELKEWGLPEAVIFGDKGSSLKELASACDIVFNIPISSSSMDAFAAETPVIIVGEPVFHPLTRFGDAVLWAKTVSDCVGAIEKLKIPQIKYRQIQKGKEFFESFNGPCDGLAARRLAQMAKEIYDCSQI